MARPLKKGMDYYPLDCDIDEDYKFFDLFDELGTDKGLGMVILLLSVIYKGEGYFIKWDDSVCRKFSRKKQVDRSDLEKAIKILTGTSKNYPPGEDCFFDTNLFRNEKILTSKSIQNRFFLGSERRKERKIFKNYFLLDYEKGEIQTGVKNIDGKKTPVIENTHYIIIEKKNIAFDFLVSALIDNNVNNNYDNVNINDDIENKREINNSSFINDNNNSINDNKSTQTRLNKKKLNEIKLEEKRREEKEKGSGKPFNPADFTDFKPEETEKPKQKLKALMKCWNSIMTQENHPLDLNVSIDNIRLNFIQTTKFEYYKSCVEHYSEAYEFNKFKIGGFVASLNPDFTARWLSPQSVVRLKEQSEFGKFKKDNDNGGVPYK